MSERTDEPTETAEEDRQPGSALPHAVKLAFMARARAQGCTASAVLREFIDSYLASASHLEAQPMIKRYLKPVAATTLDGRISWEEFLG